MPRKEVYWSNPEKYKKEKAIWRAKNLYKVKLYNCWYKGVQDNYPSKYNKNVCIKSWKRRMNEPNCGWNKMYEIYKDTEECFYCGVELKTRKKNLDHCHQTGEIRAILCSSCNCADVMKDCF